MGIDDITATLMFQMGRRMSEARDNHPKYIVREEPRVGKPLEIFEYMPIGGNIREGEYVATESFTPKDITRESGESNWYLVNSLFITIQIIKKRLIQFQIFSYFIYFLFIIRPNS